MLPVAVNPASSYGAGTGPDERSAEAAVSNGSGGGIEPPAVQVEGGLPFSLDEGYLASRWTSEGADVDAFRAAGGRGFEDDEGRGSFSTASHLAWDDQTSADKGAGHGPTGAGRGVPEAICESRIVLKGFSGRSMSIHSWLFIPMHPEKSCLLGDAGVWVLHTNTELDSLSRRPIGGGGRNHPSSASARAAAAAAGRVEVQIDGLSVCLEGFDTLGHLARRRDWVDSGDAVRPLSLTSMQERLHFHCAGEEPLGLWLG